MIDSTHDPERKSWVESANTAATDFPIQNLPYGSFRRLDDAAVRLGVAIGDQALDISAAFEVASMQTVMALPAVDRRELRRRISAFLTEYKTGAERFLVPMDKIELLLPCPIGDYTDFYASIDHANNVGRMFRPDNPLLPNYKWLPIAYHGRSSSVVVSGTPVRRPWGQRVENPAGPPVYEPSRHLDYELELGAFVGPGNRMGGTHIGRRGGEPSVWHVPAQ